MGVNCKSRRAPFGLGIRRVTGVRSAMESRLSRGWSDLVPAISLALAAFIWSLAGACTASAQSLTIENLTVHGTGLGQVCIEWDTAVLADSCVDYDLVTAPEYTLSEESPNPVTHHTVNLTELEAKRVYRFKVTSTADGYDDAIIDNNVLPAPGYGLINPDWQSDWLLLDWEDPREDEWVGADWAAQFWDAFRLSHLTATTHGSDTGSGAQSITIPGGGDYADAVWQTATLEYPEEYVITGRVRLGPLDGGGQMTGFVGYSTSGDWDVNNAVVVDVINETYITDPLEGSDWEPFVVTFESTPHPVGTIFLGGHRIGGTGSGEVIFDDVTFGPLPPLPWTKELEKDFVTGSDWHLVALPVAPASLDWATVFAPWQVAGTLWYWDAEKQGYVPYPSEDFPAAQYGIGVWWNLLEDYQDVAFQGCILDIDVRIPLAPFADRWSLIGNPFPYSVPLQDCFVYNPNEPDPLERTQTVSVAAERNWISLPFYRYHNPYLRYVSLNLPGQLPGEETSLLPWFGYWVNTLEPNAVLIIPSL